MITKGPTSSILPLTARHSWPAPAEPTAMMIVITRMERIVNCLAIGLRFSSIKSNLADDYMLRAVPR